MIDYTTWLKSTLDCIEQAGYSSLPTDTIGKLKGLFEQGFSMQQACDYIVAYWGLGKP